jgi:phage N-6-adenine-methyltransferase
MAEPSHNKGKSKQDYQTPLKLIDRIERELGMTSTFDWDLAASKDNTIAESYYTEADDSLAQDWSQCKGWLWCNPPYKTITPWVKKASESNARIAMLLPASVGSNWWRDYVHDKAEVWFLNGRVKFVGATTHSPKDHAVLLYGWGSPDTYKVWTWNK